MSQCVPDARERVSARTAGQGASPEVARGWRCGGTEEVAWSRGVVWARDGPAPAKAASGVIFASAHLPGPVPLPSGTASTVLLRDEQLELLRCSWEIRGL